MTKNNIYTKVISFNANGIRSAAKKNFFSWILKINPDYICIQETRAQLSQLTSYIYFPDQYDYYFIEAEKKGYSGVAIYYKKEFKPQNIINKINLELSDLEARYLEIEFEKFHLVSLYLPSGTSGDHRQEQKYKFMSFYTEILKQQINSKKPYIICGDWNIAHTKQDIKNWYSNQNKSGFLPKEREWLDLIFKEIGWIDAYRQHNPEKIEYTWWSNRGQAWANNTGWRIDYQIISPTLINSIISTEIYREEKFSDHAPLIINYKI